MNPNITVPLEKLTLSSRNARKTGGDDVADMAASIASGGLLQNLVVVDGPEGFEVIAGGRRLKAMQQLAKEGRLPQDLLTDGVPCRRLTDEEAIEASTAENTIRVPMHPADQFDAFKAMIDAGKSITDVAAHFSVDERVIKQRLKLANVHPKLIKIYRDDGMSLEQLQALAITDDHKAQLDAWTKPQHDWQRSARELRERLTAKEIPSTDPRVQFLGIETYEAAGGVVRKDLFSTRDEAFLADAVLLDRLVGHELEEVIRDIQAEGWSWVEYRKDLDYSQLAEHPPHPVIPTQAPLTAEAKARLKEIKARLKAIQRELENQDESGSDEYTTVYEQEALEEEERQLQEGELTWPNDVKTAAGVLLTLSQRGLVVHRARLKPGQKVKAGQVEGKPAEKVKPKKPELSDALVHRLTAQRTMALQAALVDNPDVALKAITFGLLASLSSSRNMGDASPLQIQARNLHSDLAGRADLSKTPARQHVFARMKAWREKGLPLASGELRDWIYAQPRDTLIELLAIAAAHTVDAQHGVRGKSDAGDALAADLGLDMAAWWQPTAANYLESVPKTLVLEAVAEACGKEAATSLVSLKSAAVVAEAGKKLAGTGWLPKILRGPGYALAKAGAAAKAPAKPPTKVATKKKTTKKVARNAVQTAAKKAAKPAKKGAKK